MAVVAARLVEVAPAARSQAVAVVEAPRVAEVELAARSRRRRADARRDLDDHLGAAALRVDVAAAQVVA